MCSSAIKNRLEDVSEDVSESEEEETTIAEFPDVVLQHIFGYLRLKDLKSASLACKQYNKVIWSSPEIIKKIRLKIYGSVHFDRSFHSTRKYQNIEMVKELIRTLDNSLGFWNSFDTSQATSFKFSGLSQGVAGLLLLLTRMPLLEDLSIECDFSERTSHTKVDLPHLKKLRSSDPAIFEFITASNVVDITVANDLNASRVEFLINFLRRYPKITAMETDFCNLEAINNDKIDLKLSSISLNICGPQYNGNLSAFLMSQKRTLAALKLHNNRDNIWPTSFYEYVLGRLTNLTSLDLGFSSEFDENDLYYLPQLKKLTLHTSVSINSIARYNRKLRYLFCLSIDTMLDDGLKFRNLTHLVVFDFQDEEDCGKLSSVIKNCPRIETIDLRHLKRRYIDENIGKTTNWEEAIDMMLQKPTLRCLKFNCNVAYLEDIFDKICRNYGNLEILELSSCLGVCIYTTTTTSFTFPTDPINFNADEKKKRFDEIFRPHRKVRVLQDDSPSGSSPPTSPTSTPPT